MISGKYLLSDYANIDKLAENIIDDLLYNFEFNILNFYPDATDYWYQDNEWREFKKNNNRQKFKDIIVKHLSQISI